MATNFRHVGNVLHFLAPAGGFASGQGYVVGDTFCVATTTGTVGVETACGVTGVWDLPKLGTDVIAQGVKVYWDDTNKRVTVTATSNKGIGVAEKAAGSGVTTARVRLVPPPVA